MQAYETTSLWVRALEMTDATIVKGFYNESDILESITDNNKIVKPVTSSSIEDYITQLIQCSKDDKDTLALALIEKKYHHFIGFLVLNQNSIARVSDFKIFIRKEYRSKGYGTEAIRLIESIAFNHFNDRKLSLSINSNNKSYSLYKRLGFIEEARLKEHVYRDGKYVDIIYMCKFKERAENNEKSN